MGVDRATVLKRCRSLDLDPAYVGKTVKKNRKGRNASKGNRKVSEYGLQLAEKQKVKFIYGVQEKQFRLLFARAEKMKGIVGSNLMILLELRLDNILFRMGLARTRREARQIVSHRHVLVNGKIVNIPSYTVSVGDKIEIKEKSRNSQEFKDIVEANDGVASPEWLKVDREKLSGKVIRLAAREDIDIPIEEHLIVELYSK